jgi:hypothetical protein
VVRVGGGKGGGKGKGSGVVDGGGGGGGGSNFRVSAVAHMLCAVGGGVLVVEGHWQQYQFSCRR